MRTRWKVRFVALGLGLLVGLAVAEAVARIWWWSHPTEIHEYALDNPNYTLTRLVSGPQRYEYTPGTEQYDLVVNSLGFRDREYEAEKSPGTYRILVVGDSIVLGDSASDLVAVDQVLANVMEDALNEVAGTSRYEVFSTGVAGYNLVQQVAFLERRGLGFEPDLIVIGACLNDFAPPQEVRRHGGVWQVSFYDEFFPASLPLGPLAKPTLQYVFLSRYLARSLGNLGWGEGEAVINLDEGRTDEALRQLSEMRQSVPIVVAVFPFLVPGYTRPETDVEHRMVIDEYRAAGFEPIDLVEEFDAIPVEDLKADPDDHVHPNDLGHYLAALAVLRYLGQRALLPDADAATALLAADGTEESSGIDPPR